MEPQNMLQYILEDDLEVMDLLEKDGPNATKIKSAEKNVGLDILDELWTENKAGESRQRKCNRFISKEEENRTTVAPNNVELNSLEEISKDAINTFMEKESNENTSGSIWRKLLNGAMRFLLWNKDVRNLKPRREIAFPEVTDATHEEYLQSCQQQPIIEDDGKINYYPNCDGKVWLRSCTVNVLEPLHSVTIGSIPKWLQGSLIRNGPGRINVGLDTYNHIFDGSALLHRFCIADGKVTYQNRFLESQSYLRDTKAQRIVVNYFGTRGHPDPCKTILQNIASKFSFEDNFCDNAQISVYPYGDGLYAQTETPYIYRIDPDTLDTKEMIDVSKYVAVFNHTAHPHVENGSVFNIGQGVGLWGPVYHICLFPKCQECHQSPINSQMFSQSRIVASINSRWMLNPSYMHSFCITNNYFVVIEQPLVVSLPKVLERIVKNEPMIYALRWWERETKIHLVNRSTGMPHPIKYETETFFFLHTINAYEEDDHLVLDVAVYKDAKILNCMFVEALKNLSYDPTFARMFRGRPKRWVIPLVPDKESKDENLVKLENTSCQAKWKSSCTIYLYPELLADIGCEVPRINYETYNGKPYQYFYAICSDVDHPNPGTLVKVDVKNKTHVEWSEDNVYPSEPIFIPKPNSQKEDDGIILSALLRCRGLDNQVCLLVLDASSFQEMGRVEFSCPGPVPKCLHGWFVNQ